MRSGIAWLSSSSAGIARARNVINALSPGGVIDELGFLILYGAFADYFYPAITTVMTRARYLVFVPAIYQYLERSGKAIGKDVDRLVRSLQIDLLNALVSNEPNVRGAIGRTKGGNVVQMPSDIYWGALADLGLAVQTQSQASYQQRLSAGFFNSRTLKDDDGAVHPDEEDAFWDRSLRPSYLLPDGAFPAGTTFHLRKQEAALLLDRFEALNAPGRRDCLIVRMVRFAQASGLYELSEFDHLWEVPGLPPESREAARHAKRLSLFARGATLHYQRLVIQKKNADDSEVTAAFEAWWEAAHDELARWDIEEFFRLMQRLGANKRLPYDHQFISGWASRCVSASSAAKVLGDQQAEDIIRLREDRVRPGKQRLKVKHQLESFQIPRYRNDEIFQLDYRHPVGKRFAEDIARGLEGRA